MSFAGGRDTSGAWENHAEPDGRVDEIAWTLDPREVRKEHFNVACRATFSVRYLPDLYSNEQSFAGCLPKDRLVVEWNLKSLCILKPLSGEPPTAEADINPCLG